MTALVARQTFGDDETSCCERRFEVGRDQPASGRGDAQARTWWKRGAGRRQERRALPASFGPEVGKPVAAVEDDGFGLIRGWRSQRWP